MFIEAELKEDVAEIYIQDFYIRLYFTDKSKQSEEKLSFIDEITVFTELYMPRYLATLFTSTTKCNFLKLLELYMIFHTA